MYLQQKKVKLTELHRSTLLLWAPRTVPVFLNRRRMKTPRFQLNQHRHE